MEFGARVSFPFSLFLIWIWEFQEFLGFGFYYYYFFLFLFGLWIVVGDDRRAMSPAEEDDDG